MTKEKGEIQYKTHILHSIAPIWDMALHQQADDLGVLELKKG